MVTLGLIIVGALLIESKVGFLFIAAGIAYGLAR
jgi:hypothetical protein